jgi:hypothetical protein
MIRARLGGWPAAVLLLWLVAAIVLIVVMRDAIPGGWLKDTDDYMRLMEVRDWLAGQSWYDVSQHRLNPPEGAMMHWTRLVDLPLAGGFLLLTPLLGSVWAENVTMVAVPLLLLLATMITLGWMISRLVDAPGAAEIGPALMLFSPFTIMQFMPLRIDHHGWQILMAALASAALLADRRLRGGIIAGLALGFWLTVSLEGLPFAAICLGAVGLRWCFDSSEASRLASLAATLALSAAAFFLITIPPSAWGRTFCDATSAGQLGALATAAAGIAILTRLPLASTALPRMIGLRPLLAARSGRLRHVVRACPRRAAGLAPVAGFRRPAAVHACDRPCRIALAACAGGRRCDAVAMDDHHAAAGGRHRDGDARAALRQPGRDTGSARRNRRGEWASCPGSRREKRCDPHHRNRRDAPAAHAACARLCGEPPRACGENRR